MAIFISGDDVRKLLPVAECIGVLEDLFQQESKGLVELLPRRRFRYQNGGSATLMGGSVLGSNAYGVRNSNISVLYNTETGELDAIIQPSPLATIRTGGASGVATKHMARPDASAVGIIGTGKQSQAQLEAMCAVRPITRIKAYSRSTEKREAFVRDVSPALGVETIAVASAEDCVRGSDIVIAATSSYEPVFDGAWLEPGTHVNAVGSNNWRRREVDEATVTRASVVAVDNLEQAKGECGELIWAVEREAFRWRDAVELHEVVSGKVAGRPSADAITLFESQGIGTEDVACYAYVLGKAREQGMGQPLPF
ncbi:MAG: ornithine cyclodeaminase family protein [Dehalococcoidia bacterium]